MRTSELEPGDLLLYPTTPRSGFMARFIGAAQLIFGQGRGKVSYSHVAVVDVDTCYQCEAWPPHARRRLIDINDGFEVWRVSWPDAKITKEQRLVAARWAHSHVGEKYDAGRFFFGIFKTANSNICSTFAARAWSEAGVDLSVGAGRWVTPNDIAASIHLEKVL